MVTMKPIVKVPNSVLTTPASKVTSFDKKLTKLVAEMKAALIATTSPKGVGLAAPQIGEPWRIFVTRPSEKDRIRVFINPEITEQSDTLTDGVPERDQKLEGCLSVPNIWGKVARAKRVTLQYQDETGAPHTEIFTGFIATIIQHETDHLNGTLFTYRVLEQHGTFYQSSKDEKGKEILEEIELK
jgi:peptide deformylase